MSTTDPTLGRKARAARRPGVAVLAVYLLLLTAGGFGQAYGWTSVALLGETDGPPPGAMLGLIAGVPFLILGAAGWARASLKRRDIGFGYAAGAALLGAAGGFVVAAAPYAFPALALVLAAGCALLGLLFVVLGVTAASARRRQDDRDLDTMRTGRLTTATVSDKGYTGFGESSRILTLVTFTFTDLHGTQRWVQRMMLITEDAPIVEGQESRLWYDASNPGELRGIVVELARQHPARG